MKQVPTFLLVIACSACADRGPVVAEMADLTLRVPRDQEFTEIHLSDRDGSGQALERRSISFKICDQHVVKKPDSACEVHGAFGTWVLVAEPPAGAAFGVLKERPSHAERPQDVELLPLSAWDPRSVHLDAAHAAEGSALLRVRSDVFGDEPQLSTTDRGWPAADCDQHPRGGIGCRFGFLIDGTPVVAQWFSPGDQNDITQAKVWEVASDIDRRVRRLVVSSADKRS